MGPDENDPRKCKIQIRKKMPSPAGQSQKSAKKGTHALPQSTSILQRIDETSGNALKNPKSKEDSMLQSLLQNEQSSASSMDSTETSDEAQLEIANKRLEKKLLASSEESTSNSSEEEYTAIFKVNSKCANNLGPPMHTRRQTALNPDVMDHIGQMYDQNIGQMEQSRITETTNFLGREVTTDAVLHMVHDDNGTDQLSTINPYDVLRLNINSVTNETLLRKMAIENARTVQYAVSVKTNAHHTMNNDKNAKSTKRPWVNSTSGSKVKCTKDDNTPAKKKEKWKWQINSQGRCEECQRREQ